MRLKRRVLIFIVGPTAIGKTRLSIKLAGRINGEIISCDSMQVYRGMRILSQAPTISERKNVRHHLTGVLDPKKEYSAALFMKRAAVVIKSIIGKKKNPIIVGGSGLYVKALIDGLFPSPEADSKFRRKMEAFVARYGSNPLHKRLAKLDPDRAKHIHPNDARRIIRALEISHSTGRTMTEIKNQTKGLKDEYDIKIFGLTRPREDIYSNINLRIEGMFKAGLLKEVQRLTKKVLSKTARGVLGFKEISGYLNGEYEIKEAKEIFKRNTRRFAKRQLTWFRADDRIEWFDLGRLSAEAIVRGIIKRAR